jgi:hypothetical protein
MLELVVGHNALERFVHPNEARRAAPWCGSATDAGGVLALGRDFALLVRCGRPATAAQMAWLFPLVLIGGIAAWRHGGPAARRDLPLWVGWALSYGIVLAPPAGCSTPTTSCCSRRP